MQSSVITTRITSLYESQIPPVVFACKTTTFGPELQVSMGTRRHLSFCACKTAWLAPEIHVSKVLSPHLGFLDAKEGLLRQNIKSLWVPDLTCRLCMQNIVISIRITSLYGSQPSSVVLEAKQRDLLQKYMPLWVPDLTCRFVHAKERDLHQSNKSLWVPDFTCRFVHAKQGA